MSISISSRRTRRAVALILSIGAVSLFNTGAGTQNPRFYPDDPISREPESQDASKAASYEQSQMLRADVQPVRHLRRLTERPAREELHQHHRRGAGLAGSPTGSARSRSRPTRSRRSRHWCASRSVEVGADSREDCRGAPGLHGDRRQGGNLVLGSIRRSSPRAPPARSRSQRRFSGRSATTRWSRSSRRSIPSTSRSTRRRPCSVERQENAIQARRHERDSGGRAEIPTAAIG